MYDAWRNHRNKLALKFQDPTLRTIRLYDLRHYFGTACMQEPLQNVSWKKLLFSLPRKKWEPKNREWKRESQ